MKCFAGILLVVILTSLVGAQRNTINVAPRILNGQTAVLGQFPFYVHITVNRDPLGLFSMTCGGSIIAPNWVITAAHCMAQQGLLGIVQSILGNYVLVAGAISANAQGSPAQSITVQNGNTQPHPDFNPNTFENDIGLIELPGSGFDLSGNSVKVIALPESTLNWEFLIAIEVTVMGYGRISTNGPTSSTLRYATTTPQSRSECDAAFITYGQSPPAKVFCASPRNSATGSSICDGDAGGPAIIRNRNNDGILLLGISSLIVGTSCESNPAAFTDVPKYIDWITGVTGVAP